ncbi:SDR family oxidoreductase [Teredinibacter sp. KSP-S5-2]|uniref:SDR family oxidoreductase n=1 Tax=Teredinibacter sp. KSP-S5-2 TaxID=3034506 RepID=UPI0029344153|nr:SDR family oxidoreductase [Teredinibacter sp. KSP-S5-2]WNO09286.1 SDR family oxidoreductase [Teredinibacter sp. KSP-S5-2]
MSLKKVLFVGYGDIAQRAARRLTEQGFLVTGVARSDKKADSGVDIWRGSVRDQAILKRITAEHFSAAIITLTPDDRTESGYRDAYLANAKALVDAWRDTNTVPGLVIFVSSTAVYGQDEGEWVDELSPTEPENFRGEVMLEAEQAVLQLGYCACVVRFSGIYGPGRDFLLRQVKEGKGGSPAYTNRIHAEDCAGVLSHLVSCHMQGTRLESVYLASDSAPVSGEDVRKWLAEQLGIDLLSSADESRSLGKQCANKRLLETGYVFLYPSYKEGYASMIEN